jgi:hypothetical protein
MGQKKHKLKIMVGPTVYGFEDQYSGKLWHSYNFKLWWWITMVVLRLIPHLSNLANCLAAVEECDRI